MATHSSTLAWKIPWVEEPPRLQSMGSRRVGHDWATSLSLFTFQFHALEKAMATHSSVLAWRIPGMGESDGLPSVVSHRVGHDWSDLAAAAAAVWSPFSPKDSQESSPTPQLKSISFSALNFLYSPTLTSLHDCWKNHSFDLYEPLPARRCLCFLMCCLGLS